MMNNNFATAITQWLDEQQVPYRLLPHHSPATSIEDAAQQRNISPQQMVKCIVMRDMGGLLALACVPGDRSADPKKVRAYLKCRRVTCLPTDLVESITGYTVGTVAPLLLKTPMPILFCSEFNKTEYQQHRFVTISSGSNMAGIALDYSVLQRITQAVSVDLCRE